MLFLKEFQGCFTGKMVFVTGRGPSLENFPWEDLDRQATIAHNDSANRYKPKFWFVTDHQVLRRCARARENAEVIVAGSRCGFAIKDLGLSAKTILIDTCYFDIPLPDTDHHIHTQCTGVTGGLYLAWFFRAKTAYLLGVDAWAYRDQYYFDKNERHHNPDLAKDVHHWIDEDRFVAKVHVDRHIPAMRACAKWLRAHEDIHKMQVINLSIDSQHDAFPKQNWWDIFLTPMV